MMEIDVNTATFLFVAFCCIAFCAVGIVIGMWMERTLSKMETEASIDHREMLRHHE